MRWYCSFSLQTCGVLAWKKEGKVYGIHREKKKLHLSFSKDTHVTQLILKEIRKG